MRKKLKASIGSKMAKSQHVEYRSKKTLGAKGIKEAIESGKTVLVDSMSLPRPQVVSVKISKRPSGGIDYRSQIELDDGGILTLDGLSRVRVIIDESPASNPMVFGGGSSGHSMAVFRLSESEKSLLMRRGLDPWDLVGWRPDELQRLISGLKSSEVISKHGPTMDSQDDLAIHRVIKLEGRVYAGWTLERLSDEDGKMPLSARLSRDFMGKKINLSVTPLGDSGHESQRYTIVVRTGTGRAMAKSIRVSKSGGNLSEESVEKVLSRAGREATSWISGKGKGWSDHEESALPNPKKSRSAKKMSVKKAPSRKKVPKGSEPKKRPFPWDRDRVKNSPFSSLAAAQRAETLHKMGEGISSAQLSSLKAMGRIAKSHGVFELGPKYR